MFVSYKLPLNGDMIVARVMINNNFALNFGLLSTWDKLEVDCAHLRPSTMIV
jgi:hypothetical protein